MPTISQTITSAGLTPKDIGTCERHMGQHKKQRDCRLWKTIAPAHIPWPKKR
jgi:hypothetical protein